MSKTIAVLFAFISSSASAMNLCNEGRVPNFEFPARKVATAILEKHQQGTVVPGVDYAGPGYCYKAPKAEGVSVEESFMRAGRFRGTAEAAYLLKKGDKHTIVHRGWTSYVGDDECPLILNEDLENAQKQMSSGINQEGEVRLISGSLGMSIVVPSISTHIICYFPIR